MFSQQEIVICHVALCNPPLSKVKDCTVSRNVNSYRGDVRYIRTMINSLTSDQAPLCRLRKQYSCFPFTYSLIFRKRQLCSNPNSHPTFLAATSYSSSIFSPSQFSVSLCILLLPIPFHLSFFLLSSHEIHQRSKNIFLKLLKGKIFYQTFYQTQRSLSKQINARPRI